MSRSGVRCGIRQATDSDATLLFDWVNRTDSIETSLLASGPVAWVDHQRWFADRLVDPQSQLWIIEADGKAVGQIRLQDKGSGPEIAIYVEAEMRGSGLAAQALELALAKARVVWPTASVNAKVRTDNPRSQRFFQTCGFWLAESAADHNTLRRAP